MYAKRLNLKAFKYEGGIIKTSREFCRDKTGWNERTGRAKRTYDFQNKNGVWLVTEVDNWETELKALDNITKPGYNAMRDLGAWGCLHRVNFLSNEEAIKLRPQLKDVIDEVQK